LPADHATLAKHRKAIIPNRAQDDLTDAEIALDLLPLHSDKPKTIKLQNIAIRTLVTLAEERWCPVDAVTSIANRMTRTLMQYQADSRTTPTIHSRDELLGHNP